jgi:type VI secretion system protein ImpF
MRTADKRSDRLQIPLLFAFRDAAAKRDAKLVETQDEDEGGATINRNSLRRIATESLLKRDLGTDLGALVDTIDLASSIDLTDFPYVAKSVLNYGLPDISGVTAIAEETAVVGTNLKAALLRHEPRLKADTISIQRTDDEEDANQRVRFKVHAEMLCKPLDVPVEFVAEVDVGSGKVHVARLPGTT